MSNLSLYCLAQEHRAIVERLMEANDDAQSIADTIEAESWPIEQKARNMGYAIRNLEATAKAIKDAEAEMSARRKAIENRVDRLREYTKTCMEIAGMKKIECPYLALTVKANPESVDIFEPGLIPAAFMRKPEPPPPVPDKTAIKAAIKSGIDVPGAMLVQTKRLDIR